MGYLIHLRNIYKGVDCDRDVCAHVAVLNNKISSVKVASDSKEFDRFIFHQFYFPRSG